MKTTKIFLILIFLQLNYGCTINHDDKIIDKLNKLTGNESKNIDYLIMSEYDCAVCTEKLLYNIKSQFYNRKVIGIFYKENEQNNSQSFNFIKEKTKSFIKWDMTTDSSIIETIAKETNSKTGPYKVSMVDNEPIISVLGHQ